jgi:hypothetical protein
MKKPELVIRAKSKEEIIVYECSDCGCQFSLADDIAPRDAVARLIAEFRAHVQHEHPEST